MKPKQIKKNPIKLNKNSVRCENEFEYLVNKFHIKDYELGDMWIIYDKAKSKNHQGSRLEGYFGLSLKNLRIDNFKKYMRDLKFHYKMNRKDTVEIWSIVYDAGKPDLDLDSVFYFKERIDIFKIRHPSLVGGFDGFFKGGMVDFGVIRNFTDKFNNLAME